MGGVGGGANLVYAPIYISEMAEPSIRGSLASGKLLTEIFWSFERLFEVFFFCFWSMSLLLFTSFGNQMLPSSQRI